MWSIMVWSRFGLEVEVSRPAASRSMGILSLFDVDPRRSVSVRTQLCPALMDEASERSSGSRKKEPGHSINAGMNDPRREKNKYSRQRDIRVRLVVGMRGGISRFIA